MNMKLDCNVGHILNIFRFEHLYLCVFVHGFGISQSSEFNLERDELADLVEDLKHSGVIGSRRRGLTLYRKELLRQSAVKREGHG